MKEVTKEEKKNEEKNINSRETKKSQENIHLERKKIGIDGRRRDRERRRGGTVE